MHNHPPFKGRSIMNKFTAMFERDGDWWIGYVEELPGANTRRAGHWKKHAKT